MKVETIKKNHKWPALGQLKNGDCFRFVGSFNYYMKIQGKGKAVMLVDGADYTFEHDLEVIPVCITAYIEGEGHDA